MKKIILIIIGLFMTFAMNSQNVVDAYGQLKVQGINIVSKNNVPIQLRGMSFFWSQWQGKYYTYNTVKWLRDDWKCTVVRAAMGVNGTADGYLVNPAAEQAKIETVVDAAIDLGIYVIIDWHSHAAHASAEAAEAIAFFGKMAEKYASYPNVIYEIYNEPLNLNWTTVLKPYHLSVIEEIRKYDPDNIIVCGTSNWSQNVDAASNSPITEYDNIAYSLHYYADTHKEFLRTKARTAMNNGICLFVTEFGTCDASGGDPINETETNVWWDFLDEYKISWCNWSVADKVEAASAVYPGASVNGNWDTLSLPTSGKMVRTELRDKWEEPVVELGAPQFSSSPQDVELAVGDSAMFKVFAYGQEPMTYQWYKDGKIIDGATDDTLIIHNISPVNVGEYTVEVTNDLGSNTSTGAILNITYQKVYNNVKNIIPGKIEIEDYDEGGEGTAYHDETAGNSGGAYRKDNVDIEVCTAGGYNVGWCDAGDWLEYTITVLGTGDYNLDLAVASQLATGSFSIEIDGLELIPTTTVAATGGWQVWSTLQFPNVHLEMGVHILRFKIVSGSFNIDYMDFSINTYTDCNGDSNGLAFYDECGTCVGGATGQNECVTQYISIVKGWSLIPVFVEASNMKIDELFPSVSIIKDEYKYYDASGIVVDSTFSFVEAGNGYKVLSEIEHIVAIKGQKIQQDSTILYKGWNLVSIPELTNTSIADLPVETEIVKNFSGFYTYDDLLSTFSDIIPGEVYYIKVSDDTIIHW